MKLHTMILTTLILIMSAAIGCDTSPEPPGTETARLDHADVMELAESAVQALENEDVFHPDFWVTGLRSGAVQLGELYCKPPTGPIPLPKEE